jgi:hypothetical protein
LTAIAPSRIGTGPLRIACGGDGMLICHIQTLRAPASGWTAVSFFRLRLSVDFGVKIAEIRFYLSGHFLQILRDVAHVLFSCEVVSPLELDVVYLLFNDSDFLRMAAFTSRKLGCP